MVQQWLNVAGLSFDFVGVLLLAYEWWITLGAEREAAERAAFENRIRPAPAMQEQMQQGNPHYAMHEVMREQLEFDREAARAQGFRGMRRSWFTAAMVFIALGFLLQIMGSFPGGLGF
jgi:hypothetical protein